MPGKKIARKRPGSRCEADLALWTARALPPPFLLWLVAYCTFSTPPYPTYHSQLQPLVAGMVGKPPTLRVRACKCYVTAQQPGWQPAKLVLNKDSDSNKSVLGDGRSTENGPALVQSPISFEMWGSKLWRKSCQSLSDLYTKEWRDSPSERRFSKHAFV